MYISAFYRLTTLVFDIIHYCLEHNAESEACDLLMEVDEIEKIEQFVTEEAHERVCLYLIRYFLVYVNYLFPIKI